MNTLLWNVRQAGRHLGRSGLAALLMLLIAAILQVAQVMPLNAETARLQARLAQAQVAAKALPRVARATPAAGFVDTLPETSAASAVIGQLEQLARTHDIQLLRGQYAQSPVAGTSLVRWQLSLPVTADYPRVLAFIAASLQALPTLTLEDLKLKREAIDSEDLDAELRFNLYLREAT